MAWATTPLFEPWVRLGTVGGTDTARGRVAFNKFLVIVTAEATPDPPARAGPIVLRGASTSMRMEPHDLPMLYAAAAGRAPEHDHHAHGGAAADTVWPMHPMHPAVRMPARLMGFTPDVRPYLPRAETPAPAARPRTIARLADGDTFRLEAGLVRRTIRGDTFTMYGFNGQYPGPLVQVEQGATVTVDFHNRLPEPTTVHWHGVRLENRFDGTPHVTQEPVPPGGRFLYRVRFPDAGIYWYHPHVREDRQQDLGLYGNLLVRARGAGPPPANREEVLLLDDLLVGDAGPVPYGRETATHALMGRFGNVFLVNGEPDYRLRVGRGAVVRFYLTNAANARTFNLSFGGAPIKVIAADMGPYEREERVESVVLAPAERAVVDVHFEHPGTYPLENRVQAIDRLAGRFFLEADTLGTIEVAPEPARPDHGARFRQLETRDDVATELARYQALSAGPPDRELLLTIRLGPMPFPLDALLRLDSTYFHPVEWSATMPEMNWVATTRTAHWTIREPATGRENTEIAWRFKRGDVVRLRITNDRDAAHAMPHPIHIHGQRFLLLALNGVPARNHAWKDTLLLPVGASADILLELSNPGRWMLHCHIAEHIEAGMMMVFEVEP